VDFGLAAATFESNPDDEAGMRWLCGSAAYMAPEIYRGAVPYSCAVDMWSAGVVLHLLLTGLTPFVGGEDDEATLREAARKGFNVSYDGPEWAGVSAPARELVAALLTPAPGARASAARALMHEWTGADGEGMGADSNSKKAAAKAAAPPAAGDAALAGTLAQLRRYAAAVQLPVVTFAKGAMISTSGERLGDSVYLIKKGTVEVLVPEGSSAAAVAAHRSGEEGEASDANGHGGDRRAKSRGSGGAPRFRLVATRSAGDLVGDMGVTIDDAGRASMVVAAAGTAPSASASASTLGGLTTSPSVASSLGYDSESSMHGGSALDGPPPEGTAVDEWAASVLSKRTTSQKRWAGRTRAASLRAATPVEAVRLARTQLAWVMDHDEVRGRARDASRAACARGCLLAFCDALSFRACCGGAHPQR
jgi:CRP-like cAMP-binding protein